MKSFPFLCIFESGATQTVFVQASSLEQAIVYFYENEATMRMEKVFIQRNNDFVDLVRNDFLKLFKANHDS